MTGEVLDSIAVVLPRYGKSLGGGAETLTKALLERLHRPGIEGFPQIERCEVWTTCAADHRTWENVHPPGISEIEGITVRRFPVDSRNTDIFLRAEFAMRDGRPLSVSEQLDWMQHSVNSAALYSHIKCEGGNFSALLFAPYLFATTFWGAQIYPERSIIIPCLHNEHYAYQDIFRSLFRGVRGIIFNAEPEAQLAEELYGSDIRRKGKVVGMGFEPITVDELSASSVEGILSRFGAPNLHYLLYSGRKEEGKNLHLLIEYYEQLPPELRKQVQLVLIGSGEINFRDSLPEGVFDFGFVSETDKLKLMQGALALCHPSVNESFSIVLMESWLHAASAAIVHSQCAVTREHVREAGGGLYFANVLELCEVIRTLLQDSHLRTQMGECGRRYVETRYSWEQVLIRLWGAFEHFGYTPAVKSRYVESSELAADVG